MDENLLVKSKDDTGASDGLPEEDKDFLKSLEKMAAEMESETNGSS